MAAQPETRYREVQPIHQIWVWLIVLGVTVWLWYAVIVQVILGQPFGTDPAPNWLLILLWIFIGLGFPLLIWSSKLITEVRQDGFYYQYIPVHRQFQRIPFDQIKHYEARTYRPIVEYGGWGIRFGLTARGRAYNVSGNRGVQFELKDGRRILFGSQNPEGLVLALQSQGV